MRTKFHRIARIFGSLCLLAPAGCALYPDHGWVAGSRLQNPTPVVLPAAAPSISQRFRPRPPPSSDEHRGFDVMVPGGTPVLAAADGEVARVSLSVLYGRQVMLNHGRGERGYRLQTRYFHLAEQSVREGEQVARGQPIGYSGASGIAAGMFAHLHFEVHRLDDAAPPRARRFLDPQLFWADGAGRVSCYDRGRVYPQEPVRLTYPVPCRGIAWQ